MTENEAALINWVINNDLSSWRGRDGCPSALWELRQAVIRERASADLDLDVLAFIAQQKESHGALALQKSKLIEKHSASAFEDAYQRLQVWGVKP